MSWVIQFFVSISIQFWNFRVFLTFAIPLPHCNSVLNTLRNVFPSRLFLIIDFLIFFCCFLVSHTSHLTVITVLGGRTISSISPFHRWGNWALEGAVGFPSTTACGCCRQVRTQLAPPLLWTSQARLVLCCHCRRTPRALKEPGHHRLPLWEGQPSQDHSLPP